MQLMFIILNKTDCLDELIGNLCENGFTRATIVDSKGMAQSIIEHDEFRFVASLRSFLDPDRKENKTIFMVIDDNDVSTVSKIVNAVTGGLHNPDTGIIFTVPVSYVEGINNYSQL